MGRKYKSVLDSNGQITSISKLSLLRYVGREMSTGQRAVVLCGWRVKAGWFVSCEWQIKLCDPSLTRAIPERFRDEYHIQCIQNNVLFTYLLAHSLVACSIERPI